VTERAAPAGQPRFLIFGAGAVGSLIGARLAQAGCEVTLVGRPQNVDAVAREGVRMVVAGKVTNQVVRAARQSVAEAAGPFDHVLLTVKGYDTLDALEQVEPVLRPGTILGSFQNGVGNEEAIVSAATDQALLAGSLTLPVSMDEPGKVQQHSRRGGIAVAPVSPEVNVAPLVRKLGDAGFAARRYSDFRAMKWSKLLLNILGNAQSAILDLPPARVYADSELFRYERLAFREAVAVMNRMRIPVVPLPGFSVPMLRRVMRLPALLGQMILEPQVGGARGTKMPSLWWDLKRGKGRTEARYLNGAVVDAGTRYDLPTPVNSVLWAILEQVTAVPAEWERYRRDPVRLKALLRTATRLNTGG
jgi:2-dehydropantoate 2-reductase